ncbi:antitoxin VbhA family protein [Sulfobacillus sp. DSM 109850]|uniref:Antitoxin VbhA family protein n=2 Tax=Sulfobacillus harzensis TaxID=2729629 RepID=A0A7Y0Q403_9FIRM|nr:antitoxin VbhA family protein [Sulfobacillus harzensis]
MKEGGTLMKTVPLISEQERARREEAVRFARNSVRLEGFILNQEAEALNRRYINGELTSVEHTAALLALAGLPVH